MPMAFLIALLKPSLPRSCIGLRFTAAGDCDVYWAATSNMPTLLALLGLARVARSAKLLLQRVQGCWQPAGLRKVAWQRGWRVWRVWRPSLAPKTIPMRPASASGGNGVCLSLGAIGLSEVRVVCLASRQAAVDLKVQQGQGKFLSHAALRRGLALMAQTGFNVHIGIRHRV